MKVSKRVVAIVVVLLVLLAGSPGLAQSREGLTEHRPVRRWTDEQLAEAVKKSRNVNQVFTNLGLRVGGGQWTAVKRRMRELGLDTSHFVRYERIRFTDEDLAEAVRTSGSYRAVVRALGGNPDSNSVRVRVRDRIIALGLDTDHFTGQGWSRGMRGLTSGAPSFPLEEILVADSKYTSTVTLKERLIKAGLLENRCAVCKLGPEWRGKRLVMRLDHINGVRTDNRLVNLRLLCPNCDAQQDTFAGRNKSASRERRGLAPLPDTPR